MWAFFIIVANTHSVNGVKEMRMFCFYYDEAKQKYFGINFWQLKAMEGSTEFLRRKAQLFKNDKGKTRLVYVGKGKHKGFRRYSKGTGNYTCSSRGDYESLTHQGNKEAIASLEKLNLILGNDTVVIYPKSIEVEKEIRCNNRKYEVDIYIEIERTEPEEYKELWSGELWFEVFHTCRVDRRQAEDFAIEGRTLFETKIPDNYIFDEDMSLEDYLKRKKQITEKYSQFGVKGIIFSDAKKSSVKWKISQNGNYTTYMGDRYFTIIQSKFGDLYGIVYGENKPLWNYNGKYFESIEDAKKNAEYIAFLLYNKEKI